MFHFFRKHISKPSACAAELEKTASLRKTALACRRRSLLQKTGVSCRLQRFLVAWRRPRAPKNCSRLHETHVFLKTSVSCRREPNPAPMKPLWRAMGSALERPETSEIQKNICFVHLCFASKKKHDFLQND